MGRIRNSAAGFTLLELVLAMAVMTILVGGMASAGLVARHALPDESDPAEKTACALDVCHQLAADPATAVTVIQASPTGIEFTVPDRGHGAVGPETLRYAWSGAAGAALARQYNGGSVTPVAEDVTACSLEPLRVAQHRHPAGRGP